MPQSRQRLQTLDCELNVVEQVGRKVDFGKIEKRFHAGEGLEAIAIQREGFEVFELGEDGDEWFEAGDLFVLEVDNFAVLVVLVK